MNGRGGGLEAETNAAFNMSEILRNSGNSDLKLGKNRSVTQCRVGIF